MNRSADGLISLKRNWDIFDYFLAIIIPIHPNHNHNCNQDIGPTDTTTDN